MHYRSLRLGRGVLEGHALNPEPHPHHRLRPRSTTIAAFRHRLDRFEESIGLNHVGLTWIPAAPEAHPSRRDNCGNSERCSWFRSTVVPRGPLSRSEITLMRIPQFSPRLSCCIWVIFANSRGNLLRRKISTAIWRRLSVYEVDKGQRRGYHGEIKYWFHLYPTGITLNSFEPALLHLLPYSH